MSKARPGGIVPVLITLLIVSAIVAVGALLLPKPPSDRPRQAMASQAMASQDIDEGASIAVIAGFIPTFGETLRAAGLMDLLKGEGPFTVFAPAEGAFARLPAGTLEDLMKPGNKAAFQAMIRYHVVPGKFMLADLKDGSSLETLDGAALQVSADAGGGITVNGARIMTPDLVATNGVIHVVSAVLRPPD